MAESCFSSENSVLISGGLASLFGIDIPEDCGISTGFKFLRCCLPLNDKVEFKNISSSTVSASRDARLAKIVFPAAENTRSEGVDVGYLAQHRIPYTILLPVIHGMANTRLLIEVVINLISSCLIIRYFI